MRRVAACALSASFLAALGCSSTVTGRGNAAGATSVDDAGTDAANGSGGSAGAASGGTVNGGSAGTSGLGGSGGAPPLLPFDELLGAKFVAVSADGGSVAGQYGSSAGVWRNGQFTWVDNTYGWRGGGYAAGISADGSTIIGYFDTAIGEAAFAWNGTTTELPPIFESSTSSYAQATGISGDGHVIVGTTTDATNVALPVRWVDGVLGQLPELTGPGGSTPVDTNTDGSLLVGTFQGSPSQAVRWPANGIVPIGTDDSVAAGVSDDGTYVVGDYAVGSTPPERVAFRWSAGYGREDLPVPSTANRIDCTAAGTNGDGSIVVVNCLEYLSSTYAYRPYVWSQAAGAVPMDTLLSRLGIDVTQYAQLKIAGISKDGTAVIGNAMKGVNETGWRAIITDVFP